MSQTLVETLTLRWPRVDWAALSRVSPDVWDKLEKARTEMFRDHQGRGIYAPFDAINHHTPDVRTYQENVWYENRFRGWSAETSVAYNRKAGQEFLSNIATFANRFEPLRLGINLRLVSFDSNILQIGCSNLPDSKMDPVQAASFLWLCMQEIPSYVRMQ